MHLIDIRSPRLILRTGEKPDASSLVSLWLNPENYKYDPQERGKPSPRTEQHTVEKYEGMLEKFKSRLQEKKDAQLVVAVSDGDSDRVIGICGYNMFEKNAETGLWLTDVGILIDSSETRKGYAMEAMTALLDWAFGLDSSSPGVSVQELLDGNTVDRVKMETSEANLPWIGLMSKFGLKGTPFGEGVQHLEFRVTKDEWIARKTYT